ncbi:MAG: tRNA dihydrouridine synthase DusB [Simkaniaceae bacterium]|nr:tRNA dihydrouridine synthase DusB [Simkaniaceae bacterium]
MKNLIKPLKLGSLTLKNNIIYAPLAGCSDVPFRQMSALYSPGLMYCEMVKMDALVRDDKNTFRMLDFEPCNVPIGAQLCGSKKELAAPSARIIEDLGFDVIDLNCGCPVDKVTKDGSGSGLLKTPDLIGEILTNIVNTVSIPVTVKIRIGWDMQSIVAAEVTKIAEQAGAKIIFIHGRTRVQGYKGPACWDLIRESKKVAEKIHVVGNGDIFDGNAAIKIFNETNCDGVLISRGTMGKPWIAEDIKRACNNLNPLEFSGIEYRDILLKHMDFITNYNIERRAILDMRRVGCWYFRSRPGTKKLRMAINQAKSLQEIHDLINNFDWNADEQ